MKLYLFDDRRARGWRPFSLTRPIGEMRLGVTTLRERIEAALALSTSGYLESGAPSGYHAIGLPGVLPPHLHEVAQNRVLLLSRVVPPVGSKRWQELGQGLRGEDSLGGAGREAADPSAPLPRPLLVRGERVGWLLPRGTAFPPHALLLEPSLAVEGWPGDEPGSGGGAHLPGIELPGEVVDSPWDLLARQGEYLTQDLTGGFPLPAEVTPLTPLPGVHRLGEAPVLAAPGVQLDPGIVLDTRGGPILLGRDVRICPFTHLMGPSAIGAGSTLLGGVFNGVTTGPVCRLRGEVEASIILGYSNKAHDGYLGHALLGEWVNLGALTTNSDLKNNYGSIRVQTEEGVVDTGLLKLGVLLGDHVKTGIGTLLGAGTVVGVGANLFGGGLRTGWIPPFQWGDTERYRLEPFLELVERVMGRRGRVLSPEERGFLEEVWRRSAPASP